MLFLIKLKLDRGIDLHHNKVDFEIGVIPSSPLSVFCPFVCPSTFLFADSNSKKTLCPVELRLDREIDHHHS